MCDRELKQNPKAPVFLFLRGVSLWAEKKNAQAAEDLKAAVKGAPVLGDAVKRVLAKMNR
jgi:uncharacterized membrane protein